MFSVENILSSLRSIPHKLKVRDTIIYLANISAKEKYK